MSETFAKWTLGVYICDGLHNINKGDVLELYVIHKILNVWRRIDIVEINYASY